MMIKVKRNEWENFCAFCHLAMGFLTYLLCWLLDYRLEAPADLVRFWPVFMVGVLWELIVDVRYGDKVWFGDSEGFSFGDVLLVMIGGLFGLCALP